MTDNHPAQTVPTRSFDLGQAAMAFIASLDVTQSSRLTYGRALKAFFDWLNKTGRSDHVDRLNRFDVLAYKEELGRTKAVATANLYLFVVRSFFAWMHDNGVHGNAGKGVKSFKKGHGHAKDALTPEQVRQILAGVDLSTVIGKRDYAIINLMARTGIREIEAARARVMDIRTEADSAVLWVQGKGRAESDAFVLLVSATIEPIQAWMAARGPVPVEAPLFCSFSQRNAGGHLTTRAISRFVKDAMRQVGLDSERLTPHSLRHTAISLAVAGGASLAQAQAMARHADPRTTMTYFHNAKRIADAAEKCVNF